MINDKIYIDKYYIFRKESEKILIKYELLEDNVYLCNNEKGKYYIQVISNYDSGKTYSKVLFINSSAYKNMEDMCIQLDIYKIVYDD